MISSPSHSAQTRTYSYDRIIMHRHARQTNTRAINRNSCCLGINEWDGSSGNTMCVRRSTINKSGDCVDIRDWFGSLLVAFRSGCAIDIPDYTSTMSLFLGFNASPSRICLPCAWICLTPWSRKMPRPDSALASSKTSSSGTRPS